MRKRPSSASSETGSRLRVAESKQDVADDAKPLDDLECPASSSQVLGDVPFRKRLFHATRVSARSLRRVAALGPAWRLRLENYEERLLDWNDESSLPLQPTASLKLSTLGSPSVPLVCDVQDSASVSTSDRVPDLTFLSETPCDIVRRRETPLRGADAKEHPHAHLLTNPNQEEETQQEERGEEDQANVCARSVVRDNAHVWFDGAQRGVFSICTLDTEEFVHNQHTLECIARFMETVLLPPKDIPKPTILFMTPRADAYMDEGHGHRYPDLIVEDAIRAAAVSIAYLWDASDETFFWSIHENMQRWALFDLEDLDRDHLSVAVKSHHAFLAFEAVRVNRKFQYSVMSRPRPTIVATYSAAQLYGDERLAPYIRPWNVIEIAPRLPNELVQPVPHSLSFHTFWRGGAHACKCVARLRLLMWPLRVQTRNAA